MLNKTIAFLLLLFFANFSFAQTRPQIGSWNGVLQLNEIDQLPFKFEINYDLEIYSVVFINATERIVTYSITITGDSMYIRMPVFDSDFRCKIINGNQLQGVWINRARQDRNVIRFDAYHVNKYKPMLCVETKNVFFDSTKQYVFETTFSKGTKDESKAIGIFKAGSGENITGTFLTETGDYRFLSGKTNCNGKDFYLSCFDGSHAFLFKGQIKGDSIINGQFFSGIHWYEPWVAVLNDKFELRNPDSLTYLKPGYEKIDFSFKNLEGKTVSLSDEKYKNKVVIIQIMGSWCPNCMDETAYLAPLYEKNKKKGLEIVALAFEKTTDFEKAAANVSRLKNKYNAEYEFLITEKTGKDMASQALPMLNGIMAFPTTIFIDKKGKVRKIYTGFSGPGTGKHYDKFVDETNLFLEKLLEE